MEEKKKRIHIYVPVYLHTEVRVAAAKKGQSVLQWMIRAVLEQLHREKTN